jgi:hypothetical protein
MVDARDFDDDGHFREYFELADRRNPAWRRGLKFTRPLGRVSDHFGCRNYPDNSA